MNLDKLISDIIPDISLFAEDTNHIFELRERGKEILRKFLCDIEEKNNKIVSLKKFNETLSMCKEYNIYYSDSPNINKKWTLRRPNDNIYLSEGDWILKFTSGDIKVCSSEEFDKIFKY